MASINSTPYAQRTTAHKKANSLAVSTFRLRLKARAVEYKGGCCVVCGYSKCVSALHFHHIDESTKDFTIGRNLRSWEKLKLELDKCELICANCHAEVHAQKDAESLRVRKVEVLKLLGAPKLAPEHELRGYTKGCRCDVCRLANSVSVSNYRERQKLGKSKPRKPSIRPTRITWPSTEELARMVRESPTASVASKLGVSGVAVRKRCLKLGIKTTPRGGWGHNQYSELPSNPTRVAK